MMGFDAATATASSALCKSEVEECPYAEAYTAPETKITPNLSGFALSLENGSIACTGKVRGGLEPLTEGNEEVLVLNLEDYFFTLCYLTTGGKKYFCETEWALTGEQIAYTSSGDGSADLYAELHFDCLSETLNCTYSPEAAFLDIEGGNPSLVKVIEESLTASGETCLGEGTLTTTFELTEPAPLFVADRIRPTTVLCKKNEATCSGAESYPSVTALSAELEAEVKFVFEYEGTKKEPACKVSSATGETYPERGVLQGGLLSLTFKECGGGLCNISTINSPPLGFGTTGSGNGTVKLNSASFQITGCPGALKCIYGLKEGPATFTATGGSPAKLSSGAVALTKLTGSETQCSTNATWEGVAGAGGLIKYKMTAPNPLFFSS
ncbi:MAG TPA: hypothetical protein VF093_05050 [Solirubrobacterales bacterium]